MGRRAPRPVAAALETVLEGVQPQTPLAAVQRVWPDAVGEAIAREAQPVSERDGVVTIACSSSVWAAELDLMKRDLQARLSENLESLQAIDLRFVTKSL
jgi:predicted nucleic acid-binding Zn ribbon protein